MRRGYHAPCMRTSLSLVRSSLARRAAALVLAGALVAAGAACGGDDDATDPPPSTTSPAPTGGDDPSTTAPPDDGDDATTTTSGPAPSTSGEAPPEEVSEAGPTREEIGAELRRLYATYRDVFAGAKQRGALDEAFRGGLAQVYFPALADNEIAGLESIGGVAAVVDVPGTVPISGLDVGVSTPDCVSGSATFDLRPIVGDKVPGPRKQFFKLERSDAAASWRFSALGVTESGEAFDGAACEQGE